MENWLPFWKGPLAPSCVSSIVLFPTSPATCSPVSLLTWNWYNSGWNTSSRSGSRWLGMFVSLLWLVWSPYYTWFLTGRCVSLPAFLRTGDYLSTTQGQEWQWLLLLLALVPHYMPYCSLNFTFTVAKCLMVRHFPAIQFTCVIYLRTSISQCGHFYSAM